MKVLKLYLILVLCSLITQARAQNEVTINEMLKFRAAEKVAQMNDYISYMADKSKSVENRNYYRKKALNLFVGNGEAYEEDGQRKDGVYMETTSLYRKNPTRRLMKDYFTGLVNMRYSKVEISTTKVNEIRVSDLKKTDDGRYECTAYFEQIFRGYRDGIPVYTDRTRKKVKIYILAEETIDRDGGTLTEFIVLLGDVTALETTRI